ncbi:MAG: hypothetical protein JXR96_22405 [Deltaproteobacteria bacterium]|nr:hypothetical protein [Deltaproteobacteria bacterium]
MKRVRNSCLAGLCITLTGLLLAGCRACESKTYPVEFPPRAPDATQVTETIHRDAERIDGYEPKGEIARLAGAFYKVNALTVDRGHKPEQMQEALENLRLAGQRCLTDFGYEAISRLGLFLLERFEHRLQALAEASQGVEGSATPLFTGGEPPAGIAEPFSAFASIGGDFLVLAAANDMARQKGSGFELDADSRFFVRLAFKMRWANVFPEVTEVQLRLLDDYERKWYEIWVAERSKTADLPRRLRAVAYLAKHDPGYPALEARGIVLFKAGDYAQAAKAFHAALEKKPGDDRLESFLDQARARAR